jgi:hypothetical protein
VLLETSKVLLDPSLDPNAVAETVGRTPGGSRALQYKWLQNPARGAQLQRRQSLKRELVRGGGGGWIGNGLACGGTLKGVDDGSWEEARGG